MPPADQRRVLEFGIGRRPEPRPGADVGDVPARWRRPSASSTTGSPTTSSAVRRNPGDNLLSQLVAARDDDGDGLSDDRAQATAGLVLAAGFETTVNLLGNGIALLHEHPAQLRRLQADPGLWPNAVDEVLRFDPPVLLTGRTVMRDTTFAGRRRPGRRARDDAARRRQPRPRGLHRPRHLRRRPRRTPASTCRSRRGATTASAPRSPGWRARSGCAPSSTPSRTCACCRGPGAGHAHPAGVRRAAGAVVD